MTALVELQTRACALPSPMTPFRPCAFANKAGGRFNFSWWRLPRPLRSLNVVGTLQAVEVWRGVSGSLITGRSQRRNRVLLITAELAYLFAGAETKGWAMRSLIPACIVVVGCILQSHHANAMTTAELVDSCKAVDQTAQSASGDNLDISPEGLPCWYYMSAVQNMSALVDSGNEHLLGICPPVESTTLDFVRIVVRAAGRRDMTNLEDPAALVLPALAETYRCNGAIAAQAKPLR